MLILLNNLEKKFLIMLAKLKLTIMIKKKNFIIDKKDKCYSMIDFDIQSY